MRGNGSAANASARPVEAEKSYLVFNAFVMGWCSLVVTLFVFWDPLTEVERHGELVPLWPNTIAHLGVFYVIMGLSVFTCLCSHLKQNGYGDLQQEGPLEELRYCQICDREQCERARHCRRCNACVYRMDHHCPYIANCVGQDNYKVFLQFLFFTAAACIQFLFVFFRFIVHVNNPNAATISSGRIGFLFFIAPVGVIMATIFLGILTFLFSRNMYLCLINMTSIEHYNMKRKIREGQIQKESFKNVYDKGLWLNFTSVCGANPLTWLLPSSIPSRLRIAGEAG